jgi:5-methylcytosine-specific restriction endonuclease McrA
MSQLSQYQKRMDKLRKAFGNKCVHCGATDQLHFDHIDPATKVAAVGDLAIRNGFKRCYEEALKCQLICKPCHIRKSKDNGDYITTAKYHVITWKDGRTEIVYSLDTWARENGYHDGHLRAIRRGDRKSHKGIVKVETIST